MRTTTDVRDITAPAQSLLRFIDAARLGSIDHGSDIRGAVVALRSAIHGDRNSTFSELYGPFGTLERLLDERDGAEPGELDPKWPVRWHEALEAAAKFLRRELV